MEHTATQRIPLVNGTQSTEGKLLDALIVVCTTVLAWVKVFDGAIAAMIFLGLVSGRSVVGGVSKIARGMGAGPSDPPPGGSGSGSTPSMRAVMPAETLPRPPGTFVPRVRLALSNSVLVAEAVGLVVGAFGMLTRVRAAPALTCIVLLMLGCAGK